MFPAMRFIRLFRVASGQIAARDVTDEMRGSLGPPDQLDNEGLDGDRARGQD
jgi:hypothetical protein